MRLEDSVIANTENDGSSVSMEVYDSFSVYAPAALTGVLSIQVSPDNTITWFPAVDGAGVAIVVAAAEMAQIPRLQGTHLRGQTDGLGEAAERTIVFHGTGPEKF